MDALAADDREAVARQQDVGTERVHLAERGGPVARIALDLLRVAAVGRGPDEHVAREQDATRGRPHHVASSVSPRSWNSSSCSPPISMPRRSVYVSSG